MECSPDGVLFIEENEGFSAIPYDDNGHEAWGFGHDRKPGEDIPTSLTKQQAEALLLQDLLPIETVLSNLVPSYCTQNQFDALCDFAYNLGIESLRTMLAHGWDFVPLQIPRWDWENVNGVEKISEGLAARRQKEVTLFNS